MNNYSEYEPKRVLSKKVDELIQIVDSTNDKVNKLDSALTQLLNELAMLNKNIAMENQTKAVLLGLNNSKGIVNSEDRSLWETARLYEEMKIKRGK